MGFGWKKAGKPPSSLRRACSALGGAGVGGGSVDGVSAGVSVFGAAALCGRGGTEDWKKLGKEQQVEISKANRLELIERLDVSDEERLLQALERRDLNGWDELAAALPTRFAGARSAAARALEPKAQTVSLRSDTLRTKGDLKAWLVETETDLLRRLEDGPVVIG